MNIGLSIGLDKLKLKTMFKGLPLSEDFQAAIAVCNTLTTDELLELVCSIPKIKKMKNREEWVTALAVTINQRCPAPVNLN